MRLYLSAAEQQALGRASRTLLAPLDHASLDGWRSAVNRELVALLGGDSAGFLLPGIDGPLLYSDEHDPALLARYPDLHPPPLPDGTTIWERLLANQVSTMPTAYGEDVGRYTGSAYYNEYASPNGAHDTVCAMLPLGGADPRQVASVQLWRARGARRCFGERERRLLGLLFPALTAGVRAVVEWRGHRAALLGTIDALGQAVLVCDAAGRAVHQTPALTATLAADPEAAAVWGVLQQVVAAVRRTAWPAPNGGRRVADPPAPPVREVRTAQARYQVRASLHGGPGAADAGGGPPALVLVALERRTPRRRSDAELRAAYGLTPAEARVAHLLADGLRNREISERLHTSEHTARRHTERVFQKLGTTSRAAVAGRLLADAG